MKKYLIAAALLALTLPLAGCYDAGPAPYAGYYGAYDYPPAPYYDGGAYFSLYGGDHGDHYWWHDHDRDGGYYDRWRR